MPEPPSNDLTDRWMRAMEDITLRRLLAPDPDGFAFPRAIPADITPRQLAIAALLARAKTDKQIAAELSISTRYVRMQVTALCYLLHCDPSRDVRRQIAFWWREQAPTHVTHAA